MRYKRSNIYNSFELNDIEQANLYRKRALPHFSVHNALSFLYVRI